MKYMIMHVCVCAMPMLMLVSAAGGAWGVSSGCIVCARHGIKAQLGQSV